MNQIRFSLLAAVAMLLAASANAQNESGITYAEIVRRLYDLKELAKPPVRGESSGTITSGDRASRFDERKQEYVNWTANADGSGRIRMEGDDLVAAELEGPGVIWRIWSAKPMDGPIRIIVDGAASPVLEMPFKQLFETGKGPFQFPELVRNMAGGWNCFVPIPYQKSCRIVLGKNWGEYFQFHYTRFATGVVVPSFKGSFDSGELDALATANRVWAERDKPSVGQGQSMLERDLTLGAGQTNEVRLDGEGAIAGVIASLAETNPTEIEAALREMTLSISWDGEKQPSVWCPLGDFFGSAPGINPYRALPAGMSQEHLYSSWYMPFGAGAVIRLSNEGKKARTMRLKVIHEKPTSPVDKLLRFHAKWHRDHYGRDGVMRFAKDRYPDWPVLFVSGGPGRFCGMHLHAWNPLHIWDKALAARYEKKVSELCPDPDWFTREVVGRDYWYGEGDEKFFVDGETYPSTYGTGTEDYFGFAWGTPKLFDSATQCQTRNTNNTGHISMVRYHVMDNVPFQNKFEAVIEKYHGNNWPLLYATTAYWYQAPGIGDEYPAVLVAERSGYYVMPPSKPLAIPPDGVFEGEAHFRVSSTAGKVRVQDMSPFGKGWHGNAQLLWFGVPGESWELDFETAKPMSGRMQVQLTLAPDYGQVDIMLDGRILKQGFDGYASGVALASPVDLGVVNLKPGKHTLLFKLTGANAAARKFEGKSYLVGLDYMSIAP